ncbi:MAG TPA: hypothetical protein VK116_10465, partial [Planctomycetota bacterium]|nr:hypothetical protein [Planctomycetota bacterium]
AVALHFRELDAVMQALAVVVFAFASIPIGAHMITRAANRVGERPWPGDIHDELRDAEERGERERSERGGGGGS